MLIKLPHINRKAALLAGYELGASPSVEVSLDQLGEHRATVVERLAIAADGTATLLLSLPAPTVEAIIQACRAAAAAERDRQQEIASRRAALLAQYAAEAERLENAQPEPITQHFRGLLALGETGRPASYASYEGYCMPQMPYLPRTIDGGFVTGPEVARYDAAKAALEARVAAADGAAQEAARPAAEAADRAQRQAMAAFQAQITAEEERALANKAAARLASGHWERETPSYNERRFGKPWCARVVGVEKSGKLTYDFAAWTGRPGDAGLLRVACKPGEIIAYGQKDQSNPAKSEHRILLMDDTGRMTEISAAEAAKLLLTK
jgi:hypothetical protein